VIRPATAADAAAVEAILLGSYPALMAGHYDPELLAALLPLMTKPNPRLLDSGTYHLAELSGEPAGCGGWSMEAPGSQVTQPGIAHIRHFAAKREHSRKGVGRAIYTRCETEARAAGITTIICYASLNGEPFYASLGFKRIGLIEVPIGNHHSFPSVHMARAI